MTDEEKALNISVELAKDKEFDCTSLELYQAAMQMAEWKEDQVIEKAIEWLKKNATFIHPRKGTEECIININKFKEDIKNG